MNSPSKGERGQATILLCAVLGIILVGFVAIAIDVGYFFHEKRMAQSAADAAAMAAAEEMIANNSQNEQTVANVMAKQNGFDTTSKVNPATVTISVPTTGNYAGSSLYVQAQVSKPVPALFLSAFKNNATLFTVAARAVAGGGQASPTCVCLEAPSGTGLSMSNGASLTATACGVTADSSSYNAVQLTGAAKLSALSLGTISSTWNNSSNIGNNVGNGGAISSSTHVVAGITTQCKPTLTVPTLPAGITCYNNPIQGWTPANNYTGAYTLPQTGETTVSGVLCLNSLDTTQSSSVTFLPGYTYYINGNFNTGGGSPLSGNNVTFYVAGTVNIANGVTSHLSAPTVNGVPQTLFYAMGNNVTIQGGSNSAFSGLIYAPNAAVILNNGTGTVLNMDFVSQTLSLSGGATLNSYSTANLGTLNISVAKLTE